MRLDVTEAPRTRRMAADVEQEKIDLDIIRLGPSSYRGPAADLRQGRDFRAALERQRERVRRRDPRGIFVEVVQQGIVSGGGASSRVIRYFTTREIDEDMVRAHFTPSNLFGPNPVERALFRKLMYQIKHIRSDYNDNRIAVARIDTSDFGGYGPTFVITFYDPDHYEAARWL